jgi:hypothetical protein
MSFEEIIKVLEEIVSISGKAELSYQDISINKAMFINYFTEYATEDVFTSS